jgi:hypothetical protein
MGNSPEVNVLLLVALISLSSVMVGLIIWGRAVDDDDDEDI